MMTVGLAFLKSRYTSVSETSLNSLGTKMSSPWSSLNFSTSDLMGERLIELAALLQDHVEPGSMVEGLYESEPTL